MQSTTQNNSTLTANGMVTNSSSLSECLNFFYQSGTMQDWDEKAVIESFKLAFEENALLALRILFYLRDIREGKGERKTFISIIGYLAETEPEILKKNISFIPEFGRWKDLLVLFNTHLEDAAIDIIINGLNDKSTRGLCAKWMPTQGKEATKIRRAMKIKTPKEYRHMLVKLRGEAGVVEQKMCSKSWNEINYSHVPSLAINNYRKIFSRQDEERYNQYLEDLKNKKTKVNAGAIYPHQIIVNFMKQVAEEDQLLESQWESLPNFVTGSKERILPIIDTSGSILLKEMMVSLKMLSLILMMNQTCILLRGILFMKELRRS